MLNYTFVMVGKYILLFSSIGLRILVYQSKNETIKNYAPFLSFFLSFFPSHNECYSTEEVHYGTWVVDIH